MKLKLAVSSLSFLLFCSSSFAVERDLKDQLTQFTEWVELLGQEYWRPVQIKLQQMNETYQHRYYDNYFIYLAPHGDCKKQVVEGPMEQVFRQNIRLSSYGESHEAVIDYIDCQEEIAFTEVIKVRGPKAMQLEDKNLINGERHFALRDGEDYREHSIILADGDQLVKMVSMKTAYGISTQVWSDGQLHHDLKHNQYSQSNTFDIYDWELEFKMKDGRFKGKTNGFESSLLIDNRFQQVRYFKKLKNNNQMSEVTPGRLKELVSDKAISSVGFAIKSYFEHYLKYFFPDSDFQSGGGANDQLISDLEDAINYTQNGADKNRLLELLDDLLDAAKEGELVDRRPEEE